MEQRSKVVAIVILISIALVASQFANPINTQLQNTERLSARNASPGMSFINIPAVDDNGKGVVTTLKVEAVPGEGRILANINQILFWADTQQSIQIAKEVSEKITNIDFSTIDLIYTIETEASLIEGPSAGAALTVATIAAVENKSINPEIGITGTIMPDGRIGAVGGIFEKAKASKDAGATLFLVPAGQGLQKTLTPVKVCEVVGFFTVCRTEYQESGEVSNESGIEIREVSTIQDALNYFSL